MYKFKFKIYDEKGKLVDIQINTFDKILNSDAIALPEGYEYTNHQFTGLYNDDNQEFYVGDMIEYRGEVDYIYWDNDYGRYAFRDEPFTWIEASSSRLMDGLVK